MKKKIIRLIVVCSALLFFVGCGKKEKIANFTVDAEYAIAHGNYDDARNAYNEILKLDKENRTAKYGLVDLEEAARKTDDFKTARIHDALSSALFNSEIKKKSDYKPPIPGDYSLDEFVRNSGKSFQDEVYGEYLQVNSSFDISAEFVSLKADGTPLKYAEIRVALYKITNNQIDMCVYIPDSLDPTTGDILSYGAKYDPYFDFSSVTEDCTIIGTHSHTYLVDSSDKALSKSREKFKPGDIINVGDFPKHPSKVPTTPVNPASKFEMLSSIPDSLSNEWAAGGVILKDENNNYYVICGVVSSSFEELMCISEADAMRSLDYLNDDNIRGTMVDKPF